MNFQRYRTFYALSLYSNNTHSAADFDGNSDAADIAGKLYDRWTAFDRVAESSNYENEQQVIEAEAARTVYYEFMATNTRPQGHKGNDNEQSTTQPSIKKQSTVHICPGKVD